MTAAPLAAAEIEQADQQADTASHLSLSTLIHASTSARRLQEDVAGSLICAHGVQIYLGRACPPCGRTWS